MRDILSFCEREEQWLIDAITQLVTCESPSGDGSALARCADLVSAMGTSAGGAVTRVERDGVPHIRLDWPGDGRRVMLLGHFDTVWPVGQLDRMPVRDADGRLHGPGVFDMKAGIGIGLLAVRTICDVSTTPRPHITFFLSADEEVGSGTSRTLIEELAGESDAVLVLEPSLPGGALKTSRKGVGDFRIEAQGRAAHAGVDPTAGASAVHELAHQITAIARLSDPPRGLTVNVGVVQGGTRTNVIAERATAHVDVRIGRLADAATIEAALRALQPVDPRVRLTISGGVNRPPMERTEGVAKLFTVAHRVAASLGRPIQEGSTGGGSDGNFTAALGVPTLDGLGAVGDGAHAIHEHVVIKDLPWRAALVAGIIAEIGHVP